jgi:hypothetical protein
LQDTTAGGTAAPTYAARPFSIGIFIDAALSTISYENIIAAGGSYGNTSKSRALRLPRSPWLWTSATGGSPTTVDLRMVCFGKLYFSFFNASTTATASYGHLILDIYYECRGSVDNAPPLGLGLPSSNYDVKQDDEKKVSVSKSWF